MDFLVEILSKRNITPDEAMLLERTFILLLTLPVVTTITGLFRYIIGLKSLSVYAPIILTFAFFEMGFISPEEGSNLLRGLKFGLVLFAIVFISTLLFYRFMKKIGMHYIPKTTIVMTGVSLTIILSIFLGTLLFERKGLIYINFLSVIMIATLSENLISILARKSEEYALKLSLQTLTTAIISYAIISLSTAQDIFLNYSIILVSGLLIVNLYIGKFTGLRIMEYLRFKDILLQENSNARTNNSNSKKQKEDSRSK